MTRAVPDLSDLEARLRHALRARADSIDEATPMAFVPQPSLRRRRIGRARAAGIAAATLIVAVAVAVVEQRTVDRDQPLVVDDGAGPATERGSWRQLPPLPPIGGPAARTVWTGTEFVVFGGDPVTGVAYRPSDDAWHDLPPSPLAPRGGHSAVWTGTEVIYWGGRPTRQLPDGTMFDDGAAYNPTTGEWRVLAAPPILGRTGHEAVWTGTEMIVAGGAPRCCLSTHTFHDGAAAAYDPVADRWRRLADVPWTDGSGPAVSVATAGQALVWRDGLSVYDIATDRWEQLGYPPGPPPVTTGCGSSGGPAVAGTLAAGHLLVWEGGCDPVAGIAYDIVQRRLRWTAPPVPGWPVPVLSLAAAGDKVFVATWPQRLSSASSPPEDFVIRLRRYSVAHDDWADLPPRPRRLERTGGSERSLFVWTGEELLMWASGGERAGAAYRPE